MCFSVLPFPHRKGATVSHTFVFFWTHQSLMVLATGFAGIGICQKCRVFIMVRLSHFSPSPSFGGGAAVIHFKLDVCFWYFLKHWPGCFSTGSLDSTSAAHLAWMLWNIGGWMFVLDAPPVTMKHNVFVLFCFLKLAPNEKGSQCRCNAM